MTTEPAVRLISAHGTDRGFQLNLDLSDYGNLAGDIAGSLMELLDATSAPNYLSLDIVDAEEQASRVVICRPGVDMPELSETDRQEGDASLGEYLVELIGRKGVILVGALFGELHKILHSENTLNALDLDLCPRGSDSILMRIAKR